MAGFSAKGAGVAVNRTADRTRDSGCPFHALQSPQGQFLADIDHQCAGFRPNCHWLAMCIDADIVRMVDHHHRADAAGR